MNNLLIVTGIVVVVLVLTGILFKVFFSSDNEVFLVTNAESSPYKDVVEKWKPVVDKLGKVATLEQLGDSFKKGANIESYGFTKMPYGSKPACFYPANNQTIYSDDSKCSDTTKPCLSGPGGYNLLKDQPAKYEWIGCGVWIYGKKPPKASGSNNKTVVKVGSNEYIINPFNEKQWSQFD